jgi:hypothetical protein
MKISPLPVLRQTGNPSFSKRGIKFPPLVKDGEGGFDFKNFINGSGLIKP